MPQRWRSLVREVSPDAARAGLARVRDAVGPVAWASLAAGVAYFAAHQLLGHPYPFFASVAAFSALGFSPNVQPRRVGEVAFGVTVGVAMGEAIQHVFGSGAIQIGVVVFLAALIARFLDPSPVATTQSAVQSMVVLGLPAAAATSGGGIGRWTEALLGGAVALLFSLFIPKDPRRRPRQLAREVLGALAAACDGVAEGLRTGEPAPARAALEVARRTQVDLAAWDETMLAVRSTARLAPAWRRYGPELAALAQASEYTERASRSLRVLVRRTAVAIEDGHRDGDLGELVADLAVLMRRLADQVGTVDGAAPVAAELVAFAGRLDTRAERDPVRHALVSLLRSVTFDLLRAAGLTDADAVAAM